MIVILKGGFDPPRTRRVRLQVNEDVGAPEDDPTIQVRKEGWYRLELVTVNKPDVVDGVDITVTTQEPSGVETRLGPTTIWVSPLLGAITLDDFPDGFRFGNAAAGSITLPLSEPTLVDWVVFPYGTSLTSEQLYRMQEIFEGIPPGNPERNVWRPFDAEGRLIT